MAKESIYCACNGIMPYICHPTIHPNVFFAGGDLFSQECLRNYDGLLAFVHRYAIHHHAELSAIDGIPRIPYVLYGAAGDHSRMPTLKKQDYMIFKGLDNLCSKGCRHIAFHGGRVTDATYAEGARECIRSIVKWIDLHPGMIDKITLIDLGDDYYTRFSHLLPWTDGHINRYVRNGSEFEVYFETRFLHDVSSHYDIYKGLADRMLKDYPGFLFEDDKFNFSIGVFYMNLIPQAIAKITGSEKPMHDFLKCTGWPEISCGPGGLMHSDIVLHDSGLFPDENKLPEWKKTILNELEFFKAFTRDVIAGDIWLPQSMASKRLSKPSNALAEQTANEVHNLVYEYIKCLDEGIDAPSHIVLGEDIYK